jgi:putative ABC transport system ATP-binding protein
MSKGRGDISSYVDVIRKDCLRSDRLHRAEIASLQRECMSTNSIVEACDVVKVLGKGASEVQALRGVTISLNGGELALLMGPSGSGKTTLLSVLGCMLTPTSGAVHVHGEATQALDAEQLAKLRREHLGFIFQAYHLFPALNARDNVQLALDICGEGGASAVNKSNEALDAVGLAHKANAFPRELSGGEQQRVAIARAIVSKPSVILADEPTGALDAENGQAIMALLAQIAKDPSRAVLVVTHDPRTFPFADRIVHIEDGRIVQDEGTAKAAQEKQRAVSRSRAYG